MMQGLAKIKLLPNRREYEIGPQAAIYTVTFLGATEPAQENGSTKTLFTKFSQTKHNKNSLNTRRKT